ncbi:argininosuccinate lyase [Catellatospora chokoriensis]|uniref:argininosuccinate lyase n=1 Tax=Catellatospora chokoriensis TaxID=310353 RepID=A0A8J3NP44_9ACTN|nr:lyase family protein [Catellatospora chokoriensis]GIF87655.1 argininosuccinate lyase [Catellatospora chokoriensis]
MAKGNGFAAVSGRITAVPSEVLHEEVLAPQFEAEARNLLPWYLAIEKALVLESVRLGVVEREAARRIAVLLDGIGYEHLTADPEQNTSDIAFAIELHVRAGLGKDAPAWHVDRSRNDLQACAQLMYGRDQVAAVAGQLIDLIGVVLDAASRHVDTPMPGYTHLQAAQVMTPGFYLTALVEEVLHVLRRLTASYEELDRSPLGAGAMTGQELDWDRQQLADSLGFRAPVRHALPAVASRGWALAVGGDLSLLGVTLSRFATDLMCWASGAYGFIDLPDALCGISSAMPQKRNFPVLERLRGRSAHLTGLSLDLAIGQRATPYANMVEVSKEAASHLSTLFGETRSLLRLGTTVLAGLRFLPEPMAAACAREYLGGFTLANLLTLHCGIEWRTAQIIAGRYITAAITAGLPPTEPAPELLREAANAYGQQIEGARDLLAQAFSVEQALTRKRTSGSTHPTQVRALMTEQRLEVAEQAARWLTRSLRIEQALAGLNHALGLASDAAAEAVAA